MIVLYYALVRGGSAMPVFTITFCAVIITVFILDNFVLIPENADVSLKEKLLTGHKRLHKPRAAPVG